MVDAAYLRDLYRNDPDFAAFAVRGMGARTSDVLISKMNPDAADVNVAGGLRRVKRKKEVSKSAKKKIANALMTQRTGVHTGPIKPPSNNKWKRGAVTAGLMVPAAAAGYYGHKKIKTAFGTDYQLKRDLDAVKERNKKAGFTAAVLGKSLDADSLICKVDEDKRQVFGWASITHVNGEPVVDRQGDMVSLEEVEKSAYDYVVKSRVGGSQHRRDGDQPFHAADLIESFVVTEDKAKAMGLGDNAPQGWWVGFKVNDDDTWAKVKNGDVTGFSVHGRGKREHIEGEMTPAEVSYG